MKKFRPIYLAASISLVLLSCSSTINEKNDPLNLDQYPHVVISNDEVKMKLFLPDPEKGLYRATRFDWSGIIGSLKYEGHEYFDYWKTTHDPLIHEDLPGPVEGFIKPGLGYEEASPGFIRIGVGVLEKPLGEEEYRWTETYKVLDYGKWTVDHGKDWISFTHSLSSDFGFAYTYKKKIQLEVNGFNIKHELLNQGEKSIETDQFNHNFFVIDQTQSGPDFKVSFPFDLRTDRDMKGLVKFANDREIQYLKSVEEKNSVFLELTGFGEGAEDHQVSVVNQKTGAGIKFAVDQPIYRMAFWTCKTTLCPENFIWINVAPGESMEWNSTYSLFVQ
ncbi:MAG: hypothetical protein ACFHWX_22080 [Bacteroidota bacterium]